MMVRAFKRVPLILEWAIAERRSRIYSAVILVAVYGLWLILERSGG